MIETLAKPTRTFKLDGKMIGFAAEAAKKGDTGVNVLTQAGYFSDNPIFYKIMESIIDPFLNELRIDAIYSFLILIKPSNEVLVYANDDLPISLRIKLKKSVIKGEAVSVNDIADIESLEIDKDTINEKDKIIFFIKVKWKFFVYFDLNREQRPNIDLKNLYSILGGMYSNLCFDFIFNSDPKKDFLITKGWFPFIELLATDYSNLLNSVDEELQTIHKEEDLVESFEQNRILRLISKWWIKPVFKNKKLILKAGINAYLMNNHEGFITSIKTLSTEIEGILRNAHFEDTNSDQKIKYIIEYIEKQVVSNNPYSLFLPSDFKKYLNEYIFKNFDINIGEKSLSRNTSAHGIADSQEYTKVFALQLILIIDQIFYYIQ